MPNISSEYNGMRFFAAIQEGGAVASLKGVSEKGNIELSVGDIVSVRYNINRSANAKIISILFSETEFMAKRCSLSLSIEWCEGKRIQNISVFSVADKVN